MALADLANYTLTLEDLEEGKKYHRFGQLCEYGINKRGYLIVINSTATHIAAKKGDRFKEIKNPEQEKRKKFEAAVKPLIKFLNDNYDPHTKIIVENDRAEIINMSMSMMTDEFIRD